LLVTLHPPRPFEVASVDVDPQLGVTIEPLFRGPNSVALLCHVTVVGDKNHKRHFVLRVSGANGQLQILESKNTVKSAFDAGEMGRDEEDVDADNA
jgi:hypothetical protein